MKVSMSDALQTPRDRFCYCVFISIVKLPLLLGENGAAKIMPLLLGNENHINCLL